MKGNPPFTRHAVERRFITRSWAGHKIEIDNSKLLAKAGPFRLMEGTQAVWLIIDTGSGILTATRLVEKDPHISKVRLTGKAPKFTIRTACLVGNYEVQLTLNPLPFPTARSLVRLTTKEAVKLDARTPEVLLTDIWHRPLVEGQIYTRQTGPNAGQAFVSAADATLFYFQNLSALAKYSTLTGASLESSVKVTWPAIGFVLPAGEEPLPPKTGLVISDAFIRVTHGSKEGEATRAVEFLDGLAWAYRETAPPPGPWFDWPAVAKRTLDKLTKSKRCLRVIGGQRYLNAYVGSDDKPPESMVQGALRVALVEYENWLLKPHALARLLEGNLAPFYMKDLRTFARWLPGEKFETAERGEEQEVERMDSWYLLHTMANIGRLAGFGKEADRKLFLDSLDYVVRVARHFDYDWPVFYHRKTLRVFKREVAEGLGGERDAAGLYVHVMLQAWELTADRKYLDEAEFAAEKLQGLGFGVLYQTNNTVFTAVALGRLWKETGNSIYKDLSIICMGSVLSHLWLWEPPSQNRPWKTYMGLPPLHDAPYIAPYEEAEVFAATRAYLEMMAGELPESLTELLVEYGKHLLGRARFYLPSELPPGNLCNEPREGVIDRELPVPLEDLYPSPVALGQVGQEVYGAALSLILTTHSFHRWKKVPFMIWCSAPLSSVGFSINKREAEVNFVVAGAEHHTYEVRVVPLGRQAGKQFKAVLMSTSDRRAGIRSLVTHEGHVSFSVMGGAEVGVSLRPK